MKSIKIFNVSFPLLSSHDLESWLGKTLSNGGKNVVVKINSEFLIRAHLDNHFAKLLDDADYRVVDGIGVQWALKYFSLPTSKNKLIRTIQSILQMIWTGASLVFYPKYCNVFERIPGKEAFYLMLSVAEKESKNVYILGGEQVVLDRAIIQIKKDFPKLNLVGSMEGWHFKDEVAIEDINKSKAEILFVALGSPRQEYWIRDNLNKLKTVRVAVGEGGTLDFVAGTFKRAPKWMQKLGLEWLWRLFMNKSKTQTGSRLKRVWSAVPVFIYEVVKYKINGRVDEK